jgi:hypothetical protein
MKKLIPFVLLLLILPSILAINITVEQNSSQDVLIAGLDNPAIFYLKITNFDKTDDFIFYNLLGFTMEPKESITINKSQTENVELIVYPLNDITVRNFYTFQYFIRARDSTEHKEKVTIKIIDIEDAFEVGTSDLDPESNSLGIYIHNKENFDFKDLNVKFTSRFFELEENFNLGSYERKDFNIELNKEDFNKIIAGFYTVKAVITKGNVSGETEGIIKFVEKGIVETVESDTGLIVSTKTISKANNGNTLSPEQIIIEKNIISRLFTSFSPEPEIVERSGSKVTYTWADELNPGESISVVVTTNWLYPLLIIILIVVIVVLVKKSTMSDVILRKKVSFVNARGGQFALKVTLFVTAKRYVERVNIIDRLPPLMKLYSKFGGVDPSRADEKNRLVEWDFEKLESGEIRTLSYVIYSKNVGVMGKFALPAATAIFQRDGKIKETVSNKAFFVTEQRRTDGSEFD